MKSLRYLLTTYLLLNAFFIQGMETPISESSNTLDNAIILATKRSQKDREEKEKTKKNNLDFKKQLRQQELSKLEEFSKQRDFLIESLKQQKLLNREKELLSKASDALQAQIATITPAPELQPATQPIIITGKKQTNLDDYIEALQRECLDDDDDDQQLEAIRVVMPGNNGDTYDDFAQMIDDIQKNDE